MVGAGIKEGWYHTSLHLSIMTSRCPSMAFCLIPRTVLWQNWVEPRRPGWHLFSNHPVSIFPEGDLPPLRRAFPIDTFDHFLHLLPMSRRQVLALPDYEVCVTTAPYKLLYCAPSEGRVWISTSAEFMLSAYALLGTACINADHEHWRELCRYVNLGVAMPRPLPAVWTVSLAVGDASPGRVVEAVNLHTELRAYAVIQNVLAIDAYFVLFEAHVLGSDSPGT